MEKQLLYTHIVLKVLVFLVGIKKMVIPGSVWVIRLLEHRQKIDIILKK